jgi:biotin operon repressor
MSSKNLRDRLGRMDQLFRSGEALTLARLAEELGVTERTLYRDLAYMKNKLGRPIERHPANGYRYTRPVPPLESGEAVSGPEGTGNAHSAAKPNRLRLWLEILHRALYEGGSLWVTCSGRAEAGGEFCLNPLYLSRTQGEVVLFGVRPSDGALLNLPVACLEGVRAAESASSERVPVGAKIRASDGWLPSGGPHEIRLLFPAGIEWARALLVTGDQRVEDGSRGHQIRFRTGDLERAARFIRMLGPSVRVEGPPALLALLGRK